MHRLRRINERANKRSLASLEEHTSHGIVIVNPPRRIAQVEVMKWKSFFHDQSHSKYEPIDQLSYSKLQIAFQKYIW